MKNSEKFKSIQERSDAFRGFCRSRHCQDCELDPTQDNIECAYAWLNLEAEEEKPMPCPFCGGTQLEEPYALDRGHKEDYTVWCPQCGYRSCFCNTKEGAIARHNALCRRLKGGQP